MPQRDRPHLAELHFQQRRIATNTVPGGCNQRGAKVGQACSRSLVRLIRSLRERHEYRQVLSLHQTEFEGWSDEDCMLITPESLGQMPAAKQQELLAWAGKVLDAWRTVGGTPVPLDDPHGLRAEEGLHRRQFGDLRAELQRNSLYLVSEVQNNSPQTPAEEQLLLADAAIWSSVQYLLARR